MVRVAFAVFAVSRLSGIWGNSDLSSVDRSRLPRDPVVKGEISSATSFHWSRPLFSKAPLQKMDPANALTASDDNSPQSPRLVGVVADGENRLAILELKGRLVRSQQGTTIGSWRIVEIASHSIKLENGGETKILDLSQKYLRK